MPPRLKVINVCLCDVCALFFYFLSRSLSLSLSLYILCFTFRIRHRQHEHQHHCCRGSFSSLLKLCAAFIPYSIILYVCGCVCACTCSSSILLLRLEHTALIKLYNLINIDTCQFLPNEISFGSLFFRVGFCCCCCCSGCFVVRQVGYCIHGLLPNDIIVQQKRRQRSRTYVTAMCATSTSTAPQYTNSSSISI